MDLEATIVTLFGLLAFFALWVLYERVARREQKPDSLGRITMKPGPMTWFLGFVSIAIFILFGVATIVMIAGVITREIAVEKTLVWLLILSPLFSTLMAFATYVIFCSRLRASDKYLEHRGLRGWEQFNWDAVLRVKPHAGLGPRLRVVNRRPLFFVHSVMVAQK